MKYLQALGNRLKRFWGTVRLPLFANEAEYHKFLDEFEKQNPLF